MKVTGRPVFGRIAVHGDVRRAAALELGLAVLDAGGASLGMARLRELVIDAVAGEEHAPGKRDRNPDHAIAYMSHEYSHSFLAWGLGWMADPLALDYGHPTLYNILFQGDVGDNVQYDPIFASGHGPVASAIALAGTVLGNAVPYSSSTESRKAG